MKRSFIKKSLIIVVGIVIIAFLGIQISNSKVFQGNETVAATVSQKNALVQKGNINMVVSGSGNLYYDKTSTLVSKVSSTVKNVYFKEGDQVKAGDLICEFDDEDVMLALRQSQNTLAQSQLASSTNVDAVNKLSVKTPFSGQITNVAVKSGDTVQPGTVLFTIQDTSKLKTTVEFNSSDIGKVAIGQEAEVYITSMLQSVRGTVTYISNKPVSTAQGGQLYSVEVQLNNPGALSEGMKASVTINTGSGSVSSTNIARLEYVNSTKVVSESSGTIDSVFIKINQQINANEIAIKIKNDDIIKAKQIADLKVDGSKIQIESSERQLSYYKIYAPIDGILSDFDLEVGDNINMNQTIATIKETNLLKADIEVDELDISKVAIGQKVSITSDAIPETIKEPIEGEVEKIPVDGTEKNGVVLYQVTVKVNDTKGILKGGMKINADMQVENLQNVLYVPKLAVRKLNGKYMVTVKEGNSIVSKEVEVGLADGSNIEIKSGLKEGDIIILP